MKAKSRDLDIAGMWQDILSGLEEELRAGTPFQETGVRSRIMQPDREQLDLVYAQHIETYSLLWGDDANPKTIIELGAGYGGMGAFWPEGSLVYNIDFPLMLDVQRDYVGSLQRDIRFRFVPFTEADDVPFCRAYFHATWSLTESTPITWLYYLSRLSECRAAYIIGPEEFGDWIWPWAALAACFKETSFKKIENGIRFLGVNR